MHAILAVRGNEELARASAMSRATFALHFKRVAGLQIAWGVWPRR